jgi:hypothetical protein
MSEPPPTSYRLPRSPMRVAMIVGGLTLLIGAVVGTVLLVAFGPEDHGFERGQMLGKGLTPIALVAGAIGYYVQKRRTDG